MAFNLFQNQPIANKSVLPNFAEEYNKPQSLAAKLLEAQLKNKHDSIINQYLPRSEEARINNILANTEGTRSNTGLDSIRRKIMEAQANQATMEYQQNQAINDALSGGSTYAKPPATSYDNSGRNVSADGPGVAASASAYDTFPGRHAPTSQPAQQIAQQPTQQPAQDSNIINQGNPELYSIDQLYDSNPLARMGLKKRGYEKKQETKYDPKTGVSSVITTYPSGKVTVNTSGVKAGNGKSPLTTKSVSQLQQAKIAIPQLKRVIKELIDNPSPAHPNLPWGLGDAWRPGDRKKHDDLVNLGKDLFAKSKALTTTEKALETGKETLDRHNYQSDRSYHEALLNTLARLDDDEKDIDAALNSGISTMDNKEKPSKTKSDPLGIR